MPAEVNNGRVFLTHANGASAVILLFGATVLSWKSPSREATESQALERLFVSSKAALDGSKPVRGGIPVVFPCFGAPTRPEHKALGQHGFARSELWKFEGIVMDNEAGVSVRLSLPVSEKIKSVFSTPYELAYVVTLAGHQLSTDLHVKNPASSGKLEFQALLHNYIRAPAQDVLVEPLQSLSYFDKVAGVDKVEKRPGVDVKSPTDSVYENVPQELLVSWPGGGLSIKTQQFKDAVVWNPGPDGAKIADMEENGWDNYVCVEPGYVRAFASLEPGDTWKGQQVLSVL